MAGDEARDRMGTTVTALLLSGDRMAALNVGDSRCYLSRYGVLTRALVDQGMLSAGDVIATISDACRIRAAPFVAGWRVPDDRRIRWRSI